MEPLSLCEGKLKNISSDVQYDLYWLLYGCPCESVVLSVFAVAYHCSPCLQPVILENYLIPQLQDHNNDISTRLYTATFLYRGLCLS